MTSLAELSRIAEILNQETDSYTQSLANLEKKLVHIKLGVEAWIVLSEVATSGVPARDSRIRTLLGFAKTDEGWVVCGSGRADRIRLVSRRPGLPLREPVRRFSTEAPS